MHRMRLGSGGPKRFAINSQMGVISLALRRVQTARFPSTPRLRFPAHKKGCQDLVQVLRIHSRQHVAVRHLARHTRATQAELFCQQSSSMPNPVRRSTQTRFAGQFRQDQQAEDQRQVVACPLSAPCIRELVQGFVQRSHRHWFKHLSLMGSNG